MTDDLLSAALDNALVGSPETLRRKLHQFNESRVDQVILLNQAGKTTHKAIVTGSASSSPSGSATAPELENQNRTIEPDGKLFLLMVGYHF